MIGSRGFLLIVVAVRYVCMGLGGGLLVVDWGIVLLGVLGVLVCCCAGELFLLLCCDSGGQVWSDA